MKKITVLLSEDHTVVREGLRRLLSATDDIEVVSEVENGRQAVAEAKRLFPDVVVLDIAMPQLNGMEAARQISKEVRKAKILMLSAHSDEQYVQRALAAGAAGYLMKECAADELLRAIREVARGNSFFSPIVSQRLLDQYQKRVLNGYPANTNSPVLTTRQMEVLQLIAEGYLTKQIASLLSLTTKTIEKHRQSLMEKLDLHSIALLTRYAIANGIVDAHRVSVSARTYASHETPKSDVLRTQVQVSSR
jgi:DNA-binding NarL/FixJ family response regulator